MSDFIEANSDEIMLRSMTNVFIEKKLDPVGKEDADIDNDGDSDKSDKYLHNRRKAIGAAIAAEKGKKKAVKEEMEESLRAKVASISEGVKLHKSEKATTSDEKAVEIVEKEVKNKVTVNPVMGESVASLIQSMYERKYMGEGLKQARKNVGADTCWDGYKAKGTKKKNGREVPNCVKEEDQVDEQTSTSTMRDNVTDALPWNRNTKYTTQGKLRKPGENVHGKQTGRGLNTSTGRMVANSYEPEGNLVEGERAGMGGNRGLAQGGQRTASRGDETAQIQKKQDAQRDKENAAGARGAEFVKPAKFANLKRSMPTNMRNSYEPEGELVDEASCDSDKKMNIRGYNSDEQKKRLEKKRGMKLDDHPQYKKDDSEKK